jgi:hypothetical protein
VSFSGIFSDINSRLLPSKSEENVVEHEVKLIIRLNLMELNTELITREKKKEIGADPLGFLNVWGFAV